ncbi:MAG: MFS transporter [bacterium]
MTNSIQPLAEEQQLRAIPWFLASSFLNTLFALWTFGGSIFLLFLDELGLPKGQIGAALAIFPFCGVLALWFAPIATRWGWKRVFLLGYGIRKIVMALLLLLPWVLAAAGQTAGLILLFSIIIVFALLRALAETAYYPWSQELIPRRFRGKITGVQTITCTLSSAVALLIAGQVISHGSGLSRFLVLIAAGCCLGMLSVAVMIKMPGGAPQPDAPAAGAHWEKMAQALRDRNFITYLCGSGCVMLGGMLFASFLPLYVKERLGVTAGSVVMLDIAAMAGGALSGMLMGWAADRVGSRPVLMPAAAMALLVPLTWLLLPRQIPHVIAWCTTLYFLNGVACSGVAIAASRLLFNGVIPRQASTAYTAIHYAWIGITGGLAPLLAGGLLTLCGSWQSRIGYVVLDGQAVIFTGGFLLLTAGWWMYGLVRPDDRHTTRSVLMELLAPSIRLRLLHLMIWR